MTANRTRSTSAAKKAEGKKATTTKKTATKKTATKKRTPTTKADGETKAAGTRRRAGAPRAESAPAASALEVADRAGQQLAQLTGRRTEGVTRLEKTDDGWTVEVEVVELRRIPDTTDVLATYEATLDAKGRLQTYQRLHRYLRGSAGEGRS